MKSRMHVPSRVGCCVPAQTTMGLPSLCSVRVHTRARRRVRALDSALHLCVRSAARKQLEGRHGCAHLPESGLHTPVDEISAGM